MYTYVLIAHTSIVAWDRLLHTHVPGSQTTSSTHWPSLCYSFTVVSLGAAPWTHGSLASGLTLVFGTWFHSLGCPQVLAPRHTGPAVLSPSIAAGTQTLVCSSCCTMVAMSRSPFRHTEWSPSPRKEAERKIIRQQHSLLCQAQGMARHV